MTFIARHRRALALPTLLAVVVLAVWLSRLTQLPVDQGSPVLLPASPPVVAVQPPLETVPPATAGNPAAAAATATGPQVSQAWVGAVAPAAGISSVAVTAYAHAVLTQPAGCDLGWTTLAGIGWIESENGTVGGRLLGADGRPSTAILGPALDGRGFAAIPASPQSTALHGDARWDHAVGPLQFLPSTWRTWGRDGDGDGVADPQDLNDAAAGAAAYLCGTGQDLGTGPGWSAAVFAYNHSDAYVQQVFSAASTYAARTSG